MLILSIVLHYTALFLTAAVIIMKGIFRCNEAGCSNLISIENDPHPGEKK